MISVFELFRVGIGPSSSHTSGPMRAARAFADDLAGRDVLDSVAAVIVDLFGSLAATGRGHGTHNAVMLDLEGERPEVVEVRTMEERVRAIRAEGRLRLAGRRSIPFDESRHLLFRAGESLPDHPNGMRFTALDAQGSPLLSSDYTPSAAASSSDRDTRAGRWMRRRCRFRFGAPRSSSASARQPTSPSRRS